MKKLSANNRNLRLTMPILIGVGGTLICVVILNPRPIWMVLGITLVVGIAYRLGIRRYNSTYNLFYDSQFLYLKKSSETIKVKLVHIKQIKLTMSSLKISGTKYNEYKIEFHQEVKTIDPVKFWVLFGDSNIWKFEEHMKIVSNETIIKHSVTILDK